MYTVMIQKYHCALIGYVPHLNLLDSLLFKEETKDKSLFLLGLDAALIHGRRSLW